MTSRLNPYINFDGDARAALEFYRSVFGGELTLSSFGDFGNADPAVADRVMHGQLETPAGYTLMGSDIMPGMPFSPGTTMTVSLSGDDAGALHDYWTKLSDGATGHDARQALAIALACIESIQKNGPVPMK